LGEQRGEVIGQGLLEAQRLLAGRMHEAEHRCVQHRALRRDSRAVVLADIHRLADQRVAQFTQMNPDLMLSAGVQLTLDQGGGRERAQWAHVRDGTLRVARHSAARPAKMTEGSAQPVAAVAEQMRVEGARSGQLTVDERQIAALDAVDTQLLLQMALRRQRARKHQQPGGVLVEALHHAELCAAIIAATSQ
jgi:hypothetical protein